LHGAKQTVPALALQTSALLARAIGSDLAEEQQRSSGCHQQQVDLRLLPASPTGFISQLRQVLLEPSDTLKTVSGTETFKLPA